MIAKSDFIILTLSSLALVAGVARWQQNVADPGIAAAPPAGVAAVQRAAMEPDRDVADSVAGSLAARSDTLARPAADPALTLRRIGGDGAASDAGSTGPLADSEVGSTLPAGAAASGNDVVGSVAEDDDRALYGTYRVRSGDYLGRIANRFGTSVATLKQINDIEGTLIEVGQEIRYPQPAN